MAKDIVKEIRRATRCKFNAEEKIRIVLEGLRGSRYPARLLGQTGALENCGRGANLEFWLRHRLNL